MLGAGVAIVIGILGQPAAAADGSVDWLEWLASEAAAGCGDRAAFAGAVEKRLGRAPAVVAGELGLRIVARVDGTADPKPRWIGEIRVRTRDGAPDGVRTIERAGDSCAPLTETLALMTALILQPGGADPAGPVAPPAADKPPPPQAPAAAKPATSQAPGGNRPPASQNPTPVIADQKAAIEPRARRPWTFALKAGPAVGFGLAPGATPAGEVAAAVGRTSGASLSAALVLSSSSRTLAGSNQGATLGRTAGDLMWCPPSFGSEPQSFALCVGVEIARLSAVGFGFSPSRTERLWSLAVAAGAWWRQQLKGPLFFSLGVRLLVPIDRDRIAYSDPTGRTVEIFRAAPVGGTGDLLIGVAFR